MRTGKSASTEIDIAHVCPAPEMCSCLELDEISLGQLGLIGISRDTSATLHKRLLSSITNLVNCSRLIAAMLADAVKIRDVRHDLAKELAVETFWMVACQNLS
jgi:hypothetical protein